jgi:polyhydroxyalkanoate synthesis regulator phasin
MKKKLMAAIVSTAVALTVSGTTIASADDRMGGREGKGINSLLSTLVANGTITQSQADSIAKAATDLRSAAKALKQNHRDSLDAVVTSTLGISLDAVKTRMKAGESLAQIAGSKKDALIAALVAEVNKQIDAALTAGKITAAQATAQKAKTTEQVTNMVNNVKYKGYKGFKGGNRS